jgi:hypothetical protein
LESGPAGSRRSGKVAAQAEERAKTVIGVLLAECAIPADRVKRISPPKSAKGAPYVKITVLPDSVRP